MRSISKEEIPMTESITIRPSTAFDADSIERVAQLDSGRAPAGESLVAVVSGEVHAVLPLDGGPVLADPFRPTAHLVELLRLSARRHEPARGVRIPSQSDLRRPVGLVPRAV
jgi:hypothetical protein